MNPADFLALGGTAFSKPEIPESLPSNFTGKSMLLSDKSAPRNSSIPEFQNFPLRFLRTGEALGQGELCTRDRRVREELKAKNMSHTEITESQKQLKSHGLSLCTL